MLRRAFLHALGLSAAVDLLAVRGDPGVALARPVPPADPEPDRQPISVENPRVWPAVARDRPLAMGAVEAFRSPERAAEMGVQWQRILFDWSVIQRRGPDDWTFGWSNEDAARHERDAGRPMIGQLISTPSWASGTGDPKSPPLGLALPPSDPNNLWAAWVRSVVGRFAGAIDTWVMWNEPDVWSDENHARQWVGSIEQYYQLLKVGYVAARSANPHAQVLLAGMTYWWDAAYGREQYFERLLRLAAADPSAVPNDWYFDAAVLQVYNNPRGLFDAPRIFHDLMRAHGFDKPVWVNETNVVPWDDPAAPLTRDHFRATQAEQANYLVQAIAYALAGGVERVAMYKMLDDAPLLKNVEQGFGMVRADETQSVRPIFRTFQLLRREMAATTRAQLVDEGQINRVYLEQPDRRMTVIWNCSPQVRDALIPAVASTAQLMDRLGDLQPLGIDDTGHIRVTLAAATANTIPGSPDTYFIGGDPVLVLEPLSDGYQPYAATLTNLPLAGQP